METPDDQLTNDAELDEGVEPDIARELDMEDIEHPGRSGGSGT